MTPNATVSYMATQVEQQLVEAKAARAWVIDDAANAQTPRRMRRSLPMRLIAILVSRVNWHRGAVTSTSRSHGAPSLTLPAPR